MAVLLIASGGGHLKELFAFSSRLPFEEPVIWAVPRNSLSVSLLDGEDVVWIRYNGSRDVVSVMRNIVRLLRRLWRRKITAVVTTGANHGLAAWPLAMLKRAPMFFIETAARLNEPSMSGRIAAHLPGVRCFVQYPHREDATWRYAGSVFESFDVQDGPPPADPLKILVTVGTMEDVGFRRLVEVTAAAVPEGAQVTWQTGPTDVADLALDAEPFISASRLLDLVREADVVISHAGVGSILTSLECGKVPILFPRYGEHGEHVDDHQTQIAQYVEDLGLAIVVRDGDRLTEHELRRAAGKRVSSNGTAADTLRLLADA